MRGEEDTWLLVSWSTTIGGVGPDGNEWSHTIYEGSSDEELAEHERLRALLANTPTRN